MKSPVIENFTGAQAPAAETVYSPAPVNVWNAAGQLLAAQQQMPRLRHFEQLLRPPLSFAQERLLALEESEPGAPYYHVPLAWQIEGELNPEALERSLDFLVQRHQALRTTFPETASGPVQQLTDWRLKLQLVDLNPSVEKNGSSWQEALLQGRDFTRPPFNLQAGPLLRAALFHCAPRRHLLVLVVHQLVFDGGSMRIFSRELAHCYRAFCDGATPSLPAQTITYCDFADWQRKCLQGELLKNAGEFWRGQFQRPYEPLRLPWDRSHQNAGITPSERLPVGLPKALADGLKDLARQHGVTPFTALLGSFQAFLGQSTGQEDVLTLVSVAARNQPELRGLVGLIANVVPMRLDLSGNPSFTEVLARAAQMTSSALANQLVPLSRILELLRLPGSKVTTPALQVLMLYNNAPLPGFQGPSVTFTPTAEVDNGTAKFDLMLDVADSPQGIVGQLKYRSDLFERSTMERLLGGWRMFVEQAVARPDQRLCKVSVVSDATAMAVTTAATVTMAEPRRLSNEPSTTTSAVPGLALSTAASAPSEPRTELERNLTRIWESVFEVHPIGIRDNFFGLGGHSLVAVKLIAAIEKATGHKLRLCTIFQEPTIAQLAQFMQQESPGSGSSIIEIQPKGSKPPLFFVHGVGGGMLWGYSNLARQLGPSQPIYAFKSRAMEGIEEFSRIEDMAAQYAGDLRQFQPQGPYYLGGYCFGGNVAYEMARQLTAQGHQVALLLLLNCWPNNSSYTRLHWTPVLIAKVLWNFCLRFQHQIRCGARQPRQFLKWRLVWLRQNLKSLFSKNIEGKVAAQDIVDLATRPEHERRLWRTHVQAWLRYVPQPFAGRIVLFRTRTHPLLCSFDREMGWGSLAAGGVAVKICPGDHESILEKENIAHTSRELATVLEESQASNGSGPRVPSASQKEDSPISTGAEAIPLTSFTNVSRRA